MKLIAAQQMADREMQRWLPPSIRQSWACVMNSRLSRAIGKCDYRKRQIQLQPAYVLVNDEAEVLDTIRHEIAHVLAPGDGHGTHWTSMCRVVGCSSSRYAAATMVRPTPKWQLAYNDTAGPVPRVERLQNFSHCRKNMSGKLIQGRPETLGKLYWIATEV